jgi:restriction system protein
MTIEVPTWDKFMVPILAVLADGKTRNRQELYELVAKEAQLTSTQRVEVLNSGTKRYINRIAWALIYLHKAGAVVRPSRGIHQITQFGHELLNTHASGITLADLKQIEGFADQWSKQKTEDLVQIDSEELDPHEIVERGIESINREIANELLNRLHLQNPEFFEQAVIDLLLAMGYGGKDTNATRTQLTHDGGIDGIIDQDVLGLSRVYIQAKRYATDNIVQRPAVQSFVGALQGQQANQGVFITTSQFSSGAIDYCKSLSTRVVLIDGPELANLMIRFRIGVQVKSTYHIVEIDEDFFD